MIEYYYKNAFQEGNIEAFKRLVAANKRVQFFQPNAQKAPWHVQAKVNGHLLSFWPHLMKGRKEEGNEKTRGGRKHLQNLIDVAWRTKAEDFHVID